MGAIRKDVFRSGLENQRGMALITTLLFLTVMGVLSTALIFSVQNDMKSSAAYKRSQQAFYVANAGIQKAVNWYVSGYTPHVPASDYTYTSFPVQRSGNDVLLAGQTGSSSNYPNSTVATNFGNEFANKALEANDNNNGVYAVNSVLTKYIPTSFINPATFISYPSAIERWRITSIGYWGSTANPMGVAQITATVENSGNALFDRALWGIDWLDLGGTVRVDSYDPARPYSLVDNWGSLGSIGSNGNITLNGAVTVWGDAAHLGTCPDCPPDQNHVKGNDYQLAQPHTFPSIPNFTVVTPHYQSAHVDPPYNYNPKNGTVSLPPGTYGRVDIDTHGVLELTGGTYYFDRITESATASLKISGDTTIFIKSGLDLSGQGVMNNLGDPTKLTVFYSGTSEMKMTGGTQAYIEAYAPNAPLTLVGTSDFYGSFTGKTVTISGTPRVHFDEGCWNEHLLQKPFRLMTWAQTTN
jgi:type II secretory pathway pseudopilin PulG